MTYAAIYTAATDPVFQGRCLVAAWQAAQDILAEPTDTVDYGGRRGWATNILQGRLRLAPRAAGGTVVTLDVGAATITGT